jgi:hypothetical protein
MLLFDTAHVHTPFTTRSARSATSAGSVIPTSSGKGTARSELTGV